MAALWRVFFSMLVIHRVTRMSYSDRAMTTEIFLLLQLDYYLLCVPSQSLSVLFMALCPLCHMLYNTEYKESPVPNEYLNWGFCRSDPLLVKAWIATSVSPICTSQQSGPTFN